MCCCAVLFRVRLADTAAAVSMLKDAALLTGNPPDVTAGRIPLAIAKHRCETEMLRYGFEAAANSTKPFFADAMRRRIFG